MAQKSTILILTFLFIAGCDTKLDIPKGTTVQYNNVHNTAVTLEDALAGEIITKLNEEPDSKDKGAAMGLDTRKYLRVGRRTFQVLENRVVLIDGWGIRTWIVEDIEAKLDALIVKTPVEFNAPETEE